MLDKTKLGFEEITQELLQKVLSRGVWKDSNLSSTGRMIIELYAYVAQLLLYYIKRAAEEQFVDTARFWSSLVRMAYVLGVPVVRPRGCFGRLRMRLRSDASVNQKTVARFTRVVCDEVPFYVDRDVVIYKNEWVDVLVKQGLRRSVEFTVQGSGPVWQFKITDSTASDEDLVVKVGDVYFSPVTDFFELLNGEVVRVTTGVDKSLVLTFYEAFGGLLPGQKVKVEYSSVVEGYLPPVDGVWSIDDEDVELGGVSESFVSGGKWEDIERFRSRFINYFGTGKRIVTKEDLEKMLLSMPEVEKVKVWDVKDEFKGPFRGAIAYVKPVGGFELVGGLRRKIDDLVSKLRVLGMKVDVFGVQRVDVDVYVKVSRKLSVTVEDMVREIVEKLREVYSSVEIGQWITRFEIAEVVRSLGYRGVKVVLPDRDLELRDNQCVSLREVRVQVE